MTNSQRQGQGQTTLPPPPLPPAPFFQMVSAICPHPSSETRGSSKKIFATRSSDGSRGGWPNAPKLRLTCGNCPPRTLQQRTLPFVGVSNQANPKAERFQRDYCSQHGFSIYSICCLKGAASNKRAQGQTSELRRCH